MKKQYKILIGDDEDYIHNQVISSIGKEFYDIKSAYEGTEVWNMLEKEPFDLLLLDVYFPDVDDLSLLERITKKFPSMPVIMFSGNVRDNITLVVEAIKIGAFDFISKPINVDELRNRIQNLFKLKKIETNEAGLIASIKESQYDIVGNSKEIKKVLEKIDKVANTDNVVLIEGETGTGKELVAKAIHFYGSRKRSPFISLNCSALPSNIVEAELFGYDRGAFTGAVRKTPGKFDLAGEGTIFLDEIGDLPIEIQPKLLRVLENGEYTPLGNLPMKTSKARVIAATNRNLKFEVKDKRFREDLYYRLAAFKITLPPLRTRGNDIIKIANYFLDVFNQKSSKNIKSFSSKCLDTFMQYDWPGNVRQLHNVIETCYIMEEGEEISTRYLLPEIIRETEGKVSKSKFETKLSQNIERDEIIEALELYGYNRNKTARYLGIHRNTLRNKMYKYEIESPKK